MRLERARPQHLSEIVRIERACFSDAWSAQGLSAEIEAGRMWCAITDGDAVAGYIVAWNIAGECEIANLAVDPTRRRQGIGRALLAHILAWDAQRFFLEVRVGNTAARALYAASGFVEYGVRKNYYRSPTEDALLLYKDKTDVTTGY